jgi:hypothetical protein
MIKNSNFELLSPALGDGFRVFSCILVLNVVKIAVFKMNDLFVKDLNPGNLLAESFCLKYA